MRRLQAEVARLTQPPPTSRHSCVPPSRAPKAQLPPPAARPKHGPPVGHERPPRPLVEMPTQVIIAAVAPCQACHADLQAVAPHSVPRRQVTALPVVVPVVIETQQHAVVCPHCQRVNRGVLPPGLAATRQFGPPLEATVVYLKHTQHLSSARVVQVRHDCYGVRVCEGAVDAIVPRAGRAAQDAAATIRAAVQASPIIHSDETSARVGGAHSWQWVLGSAAGIYHTLVPSPRAAIITALMGAAVAQVWVSECFSAPLKAPAQVFQLCLAHQLRDLQRVLEDEPQHAWAQVTRALWQRAIHLHHQYDCLVPEITLPEFVRLTQLWDDELDDLLTWNVTGEWAVRLQARCTTHRAKLLTFLHYPGVPPTNNVSERALRGSVIHRKVTNGFRSEWGAKGYAALQSVLATAQLKGEQLFATLVALRGTPVLHFLPSSHP